MKRQRARILAVAIPAALVLSACDFADRPADTALNEPIDQQRADRAPSAAPNSAPGAAPSTAPRSDVAANTPRGTADSASAALDKAGNAVSSASVTAAVKAELMKEPSLSAMAIDVDTASNGKVTLSGEVGSTTAKKRAEELARATNGVRDVENKLVVRPA